MIYTDKNGIKYYLIGSRIIDLATESSDYDFVNIGDKFVNRFIKQRWHSFQLTESDLDQWVNFKIIDIHRWFKQSPYLYLYQLDYKLNPDVEELAHYDYTEHIDELIPYLKLYADQLLGTDRPTKLSYHLAVNYILLTKGRLINDSDKTWISLFYSKSYSNFDRLDLLTKINNL